jgi:hypothetical protein
MLLPSNVDLVIHLWVNIEYVEIRTIMGMEMLKLKQHS